MGTGRVWIGSCSTSAVWSPSFRLSLAPSPSSDTNANQQNNDCHAATGDYSSKPFPKNGEYDGPDCYGYQCTSDSGQEAVAVCLHGRKVEEAGTGRMRRYDEYIVIAWR